MVLRRLGAALAITAMMVPAVSQAAMTPIGTVLSGSGALIARDGKVIPAVAGMKLYSSDRLITRAEGSARVAMANSCSVSVGASAMLPMAGASCAKPNVVSFDDGRAGYAGRSSAFESQSGGHLALYAALVAAWVGGTYFLLDHKHRNPNNTPVSP